MGARLGNGAVQARFDGQLTLFFAPPPRALQACVVRHRAANGLDHAPGQGKFATQESFPGLRIRVAPYQRNAGLLTAARAGCLFMSICHVHPSSGALNLHDAPFTRKRLGFPNKHSRMHAKKGPCLAGANRSQSSSHGYRGNRGVKVRITRQRTVGRNRPIQWCGHSSRSNDRLPVASGRPIFGGCVPIGTQHHIRLHCRHFVR